MKGNSLITFCSGITHAGENMEGYCVKCKKKVEIQNGKEVVNAKGRAMMKGKCPACGTTVCRILGMAKSK